MDGADANPLDLLRQLESESLGNQLDDAERERGDQWQGFVFDVDGHRMVLPFVGEFEIYPCGELAPIPMAKSWVRGIANVRGEIYTVVDLPEFLGCNPIRSPRGGNLILLPDPRLRSALLVMGRVGLRSFPEDLPEGQVDGFPARLTPYLKNVVIDGDENWGVIDIEVLSYSEEFVNISG